MTTLILRENRISEFPSEVGALTQLTALDLSHNNLRHLPPGVCVHVHERARDLHVHVRMCDCEPKNLSFSFHRNWQLCSASVSGATTQ